MPKDEQTDVAYFNKEAEQAVLGGILLEPRKCMVMCRELDIGSEWFYWETHRTIWMAIDTLAESGEKIDSLTVTNYIIKKYGEGKVEANEVLACINNCVTPAYTGTYLDILKDKYHRRKLRQYGIELTAELKSETSVDELISQLRFKIQKLKSRERLKRTPIEGIMDIADEFRNAKKEGFSGIPSRWYPLQRVLGSYQPGMNIIAGRPKQGKTTLMCNEILHEARVLGKTIGVISMEMREAKLRARMIGDLADLDIFKLQNGRASNEEIERFVEYGRQMAILPIKILDGPQTLEHTVIWMRDHNEECDLFWIDYLQMFLRSAGTPKSEYDRVTQASNTITNFANEIRKPVCCLSQFSRGAAVDNKGRPTRPKLHHLRGSGSLEQDAEKVTFIYQDPESYDDEGSGGYHWYDDVPTIVEVAANRSGPTKELKFTFKKTLQKLIPKDAYESETSPQMELPDTPEHGGEPF